MTVVDDWVGDDEEVLPVRAAPAAQPVLAPPANSPTSPPEAKPRRQNRPLLARGTIALGGAAAAGTTITIAGVVGGAFVAVAAAGGCVLVPLAVWRARQSRTGQRAARRRARPVRTRSTRRNGGIGSWLPGGLGGGGKRGGGIPRLTGTGRSAGTGGRRPAAGGGAGRTGGARAGAIPRPRMPRLGTGGRAGAGRAGGLPRLRTSRAGGRVRGAGGLPRLGRTGGRAGGNASRLRGLGTGGRVRGLGGGGGGRHGGRLPTRRMVRRAVRRGQVPPTSVRPTRIARLGTGVNRQGFQVGAAVRRGVRQPTSRAAASRAYRRFVRKAGKPTTMTGAAGRVIGGVLAGASAGGMRLGWNGVRKAGRALRTYYQANTQQPTPATGVPPTAASAATRLAPAQHPVPPPAFAPPAAPSFAPTPAGAGAGTTTPGGTVMSTTFPPQSHASSFFDACNQWQPLGPDGRHGSIWTLQAALPWAIQSVALIANGWAAFATNCETTLEGGLHAGMKQALNEVYRPLVAAANTAVGLQKVFADVYAEDIVRANTRGGHTRNVNV